MLDVDLIRRTARHSDSDVLIGAQGTRLVVVIGRVAPASPHPAGSAADPGPTAEPRDFLEIARRLEDGFGPGSLVLGHEVADLLDASKSARAALAGFAVAGTWRAAPRPTLADDLLPERAFAGDPIARGALVTRIYRPLHAHAKELPATLWAYLDNGRSLEATARELFVHPNTVRYRLKRITEIIGWDATIPRDALVLQSALIVGSIAEAARR